MSLMSIFDISGSAMSAQSIRLNATASNMAKRSRSKPTLKRRGDGPPLSTKA